MKLRPEQEQLTLFFINVELLTGKDAFEDRERWIEGIQSRCSEKRLPTDDVFLIQLANIVGWRWGTSCSEASRGALLILLITSLWHWYCEREGADGAG